MIVLAVLLGAAAGWVAALTVYVVHERRRPALTLPPQPPPPPATVDHTMEILAAMTEAIVSAATETSKAIGASVQTAMGGPPTPAPVTRPVWQFDPDIRDGTVDDSDPTDAFRWLGRAAREDVAMLAHGESPIPGVELRP